MSTEIINSKYSNIGIYKKQRKFCTKRRIIFMIIFLSFITFILYLIFRPSKKSPKDSNNSNNNLSGIDKEIAELTKKEQELKTENDKLKEQKDSLIKGNEEIEKQIKELNDKIKQNEDNKKNDEKEIKEKKDKIKEYEDKLEKIKEKIKELNKKGKDLKDKKEDNDKEIKSLESKISELEKELKNDEKEENKKEEDKKEEEKTDNNNEDKKEENKEPQPINPELVSRIDSKIIMETKQLELLDKWFGKKLKYKLLYRASEENYSSDIFHKKVDEYKNTIIFIKDINNFIYGGFTTRTWDGNKLYKSDKNAILFNLDKEKYYEVNNIDHAIFCDKDLIGAFGDGDLLLGPKSIESSFPKSYGNKDIKENDLTMGYNKLSPVEMEVFQLS